MKPISQRNADLVFESRQSPRFYLWRSRSQLEIGVLRELGKHPEPALVPFLLSSVFDGQLPVARAAAETLHRAIGTASARDLVDLDEECRRFGWDTQERDAAWRTLRPPMLSRVASFGETEVSVLGVVSFHHDGFLREAAVARLDDLTTGLELPFLLVRLNDWVEPVARRARDAVARRIVPDRLDAFIAYLPLLLRLDPGTRRPQGDLLERVYALLVAPEGQPALERGLASTDRETRREIFTLAQRAATSGPALASLTERALGDSESVIRSRAVAEACSRLDDAELAAVLPRMLRDPFPRIRAAALAAAAHRGAGNVDAALVSSLMDRNRVVREIAQFHTRRRGLVPDVAALYRARLADTDATPRTVATAVAGLGETGTTDDMRLVLPLLAHERAYVRAAAVRALAALDADGQLPRFVEALGDPAPSVSRAAREALRPRARLVGAVTLARVVRDTPHSHGRVDALAAAAALGKWDRLPILVESTASFDERVRALADQQLTAWIARQNRESTPPTQPQIDAARAALDAHRPTVAPFIARELNAVLRFWSE